MDFDQLTTFLEVAKLGTFSRAGDRVFRSQSAVSAQIRQLEQDYGTKLLDRSGASRWNCPSVAMVKTFIAMDIGVPLISESFAANERRTREARLIPLADVDPWRELGLIYD